MKSPSELQSKILQAKEVTPAMKESIIHNFKVANSRVRDVRKLKYQNRVSEQVSEVCKLRETYGSYRNIAAASGVPVKTVYKWCSSDNDKVKKRVQLSQLRMEEYEQFLLQDTISFPHPCKKYSGKRYLKYTMEDV